MRKLSDLKVGEICIIKSFLDDALATKLISMGVYPNSRAKIFHSNHKNYALFIVIGTLKIALLKEEASTILVKKMVA